MRIYSSLKEAYKETLRELFEMGTEVKVQSMQNKPGELETKELWGYGLMISNQGNNTADFLELGGELSYADQELIERITPSWVNPGIAWTVRKETWEQFLVNGKMDYTYNERYRTQLERVIEELKTKPGTRQAVMTVYDQHHDLGNWGGKARIPCSMYYQFIRRKVRDREVLHCVYTMRSCDALTHLLYDLYMTMKLQEYVANAVGIDPGTFTYFAGSLHAYKKDIEKQGIF